MSGGKRRLPNLPQLLPIWAVAIFPTERQNERELEQRRRRKGEKIIWHSLPAAPLNGFFQHAELGLLSSCLAARTQAKPGRLAHLHKCWPRLVRTPAHTGIAFATHYLHVPTFT